MGKPKTYNYKKGFKFRKENLEYTFQLRKRNWKWLWLLLLLLPLLLLIRCEREIAVSTVAKVSKDPISNVKVTMKYNSHYLYNDGHFFTSTPETHTITTDKDGNGKFTKLGCSVYSYIFYCLSKAEFTVEDKCHKADPDPTTCNFHYTWHKDITLSEIVEDLNMEVVDRETGDPLADAGVVYQYKVNGENRIDSARTTPAGQFVVKGAPVCGIVDFKLVSCYGYEDLKNHRRHVPNILSSPDSARLALVPLKTSFTYFVKNKFTKEPIPGATVNVTLTSGNGKVLRGQSTTNVDGKGRGAYKDAFILAKVDLKATKSGYKDGHLDGDYTVEQFSKLPDEQRVVYLEPEPYLEEFQNVDSITGVPIAGVENAIHRESIDGNSYDITETSNRNGKFSVTALAGDKLDITSSHRYYETKKTVIAKFDKGRIIKMKPKQVSLKFRTVDGVDWSLLGGCALEITTADGRSLKPTNSGNGEFTVDGLYCSDKLSITASKSGFGTNDVTINNTDVYELIHADQKKRDIPLNEDLPPCNGGNSGEDNVAAGTVSAPQSFNMGKDSGVFNFEYYTGNACPDEILIYNHKPGENYANSAPIWKYPMGCTQGNLTNMIKFDRGSVITIVVKTGPADGSAWNYHVYCPL